jgi:hypothetical protein
MKIQLFILAVFLGFLSALDAQNADTTKSAPLSTGPILGRAPEFAHWQIAYTYRSATSPTPMPTPDSSTPKPSLPRTSDPKQISVTKTGGIYHRETVYDDGGMMDQWWANGSQVTQRRNYPDYLLSIGSGRDMFYVNYSLSDFPDLYWITLDAYTGMQKLNGVDCLVFKGEIPKATQETLQGMDPDAAARAMRDTKSAMAWVDFKTRLPIQIVSESEKQTYTFLQPPPALLMLPVGAVKVMAAWEAKKAQLSRPAPRP